MEKLRRKVFLKPSFLIFEEQILSGMAVASFIRMFLSKVARHHYAIHPDNVKMAI